MWPKSNTWRVALVVLGLAAVIAGVLSTSRYVEICDQAKNAEQENCAMYHVALFLLLKVKEALSDLEPLFVGLGTIAIATFTWRLWVSTAALWRHTRTVERAYVKLSHTSPPGVSFDVPNAKVFVSFQVRNAGRTPATITDVVVTPAVLPGDASLPASPLYAGDEGYPFACAFLVAGDHIVIDTSFSLPEMKAVRTKTMTLYFVGYVDYIDAFDIRHRSGYARRYDHRRDADPSPNNLVFVPERAYHYDRRRLPGEGRDWDDSNA
jgi:hypothetical protein